VARDALHVQCPWRLRRGAELLVAKDDRYRPASTIDPTDESADLDRVGANLWDEKSTALRVTLAASAVHVRGVVADDWAG
jgi:hypothetical protein